MCSSNPFSRLKRIPQTGHGIVDFFFLMDWPVRWKDCVLLPFPRRDLPGLTTRGGFPTSWSLFHCSRDTRKPFSSSTYSGMFAIVPPLWLVQGESDQGYGLACQVRAMSTVLSSPGLDCLSPTLGLGSNGPKSGFFPLSAKVKSCSWTSSGIGLCV